MRLIPLIPAALIVLAAAPAWAQDWMVVTKTEDGFRANFPGQPKVETITYVTEFRLNLPGRVYRAADALGRYSTTVVDYRDAQRLHGERTAKCLAAKGANQQDGDACQNAFMGHMAGATDHAAWHFLRRDGVKVTQYGLYNVDRVAGPLVQLTNPDRSRTYASMHQHAGRLYIHEATVPDRMPNPFCSCSRWPGSTTRGWRSATPRCNRRLRRRLEVPASDAAAAHAAGPGRSDRPTGPAAAMRRWIMQWRVSPSSRACSGSPYRSRPTTRTPTTTPPSGS